MRTIPLVLSAALLFACAGPAAAQAVKIEFSGGRVTVVAQNAPARAVLAEWARLGGTRIVNGDQIAGAALTLELIDYPERQALEIILRNVPGYIVSARQSPGVGGASTFDRVLILATSSAPRPTSAATFGAPPQRPTFDTDADDFLAVQRANEQNRAEPAVRVVGQPVVVTQPPPVSTVIRQGGVGIAQPFFPQPTPAPAPPPVRPAPGQTVPVPSIFAPTPVPPQQPQDTRAPNTNDR